MLTRSIRFDESEADKKLLESIEKFSKESRVSLNRVFKQLLSFGLDHRKCGDVANVLDVANELRITAVELNERILAVEEFLKPNGFHKPNKKGFQYAKAR